MESVSLPERKVIRFQKMRCAMILCKLPCFNRYLNPCFFTGQSSLSHGVTVVVFVFLPVNGFLVVIVVFVQFSAFEDGLDFSDVSGLTPMLCVVHPININVGINTKADLFVFIAYERL